MKRGSINLIQKTKFNQEWHPKEAPGPVQFKAEKSVKMVMATIFWDFKGVILINFLEGRKTVISNYYEDILKKLKTSLAKKHHEKLHSCKLRWETFPHPPYSLDLDPSDFFCFQN